MVEDPQVIIESLLPYTNYTFYLVAYNKLAASQHSQPVYHITSQDGE